MEKITRAAEKWSKGEPTGYVDCAAKDIVWLDELGALKPISGSEALKKYLESFKGKVVKIGDQRSARLLINQAGFLCQVARNSLYPGLIPSTSSS